MGNNSCFLLFFTVVETLRSQMLQKGFHKWSLKQNKNVYDEKIYCLLFPVLVLTTQHTDLLFDYLSAQNPSWLLHEGALNEHTDCIFDFYMGVNRAKVTATNLPRKISDAERQRSRCCSWPSRLTHPIFTCVQEHTHTHTHIEIHRQESMGY